MPAGPVLCAQRDGVNCVTALPHCKLCNHQCRHATLYGPIQSLLAPSYWQSRVALTGTRAS